MAESPLGNDRYPVPSDGVLGSVVVLHDRAASSALLWRIGVLAPRNCPPYRRHHVVARAVAVCDDTVIGQLVAGSSPCGSVGVGVHSPFTSWKPGKQGFFLAQGLLADGC